MTTEHREFSPSQVKQWDQRFGKKALIKACQINNLSLIRELILRHSGFKKSTDSSLSVGKYHLSIYYLTPESVDLMINLGLLSLLNRKFYKTSGDDWYQWSCYKDPWRHDEFSQNGVILNQRDLDRILVRSYYQHLADWSCYSYSNYYKFIVKSLQETISFEGIQMSSVIEENSTHDSIFKILTNLEKYTRNPKNNSIPSLGVFTPKYPEETSNFNNLIISCQQGQVEEVFSILISGFIPKSHHWIMGLKKSSRQTLLEQLNKWIESKFEKNTLEDYLLDVLFSYLDKEIEIYVYLKSLLNSYGFHPCDLILSRLEQYHFNLKKKEKTYDCLLEMLKKTVDDLKHEPFDNINDYERAEMEADQEYQADQKRDFWLEKEAFDDIPMYFNEDEETFEVEYDFRSHDS